jgi:hypothetical protein
LRMAIDAGDYGFEPRRIRLDVVVDVTDQFA